jgi:RNA ligase (TIGR02306 family)
MSSLFVKVVEYTLRPHPNADSLSIATPHGTSWSCCVRTEGMPAGGLAVYIPIDSILPEGMGEKLGLPNSKAGETFRVRTIKLRGALSQGLLLPLSTLVDGGFLPRFKDTMSGDLCAAQDWRAGDDVAELLGITKWEPPMPESADLQRNPSGFNNYTSPEHFKNFPEVIQHGEMVVITEKIHGTSIKFGWIETGVVSVTVSDSTAVGNGTALDCPETREEPEFTFFVGTKNNTVIPGHVNKYTRVADEYNVERRLRDYPGYTAYGELYGKGIQSLQYGKSGHALRIFDVFNGQRFLDWEELKSFALETGLPLVPTLYEGPWDEDSLSHRFGRASEGDHIREGFVVKPARERWDYEHGLGRVILKVVSELYLLGDHDLDEVG